jgi:hypothetical protein
MYDDPPDACDECGDRERELQFWARRIPHWVCNVCYGQQPKIQLTYYDGTDEDEPPMVEIEVYGKRDILRAVRDMTVAGCSWEFPDSRSVDDLYDGSGALGHACVTEYVPRPGGQAPRRGVRSRGLP